MEDGGNRRLRVRTFTLILQLLNEKSEKEQVRKLLHFGFATSRLLGVLLSEPFVERRKHEVSDNLLDVLRFVKRKMIEILLLWDHRKFLRSTALVVQLFCMRRWKHFITFRGHENRVVREGSDGCEHRGGEGGGFGEEGGGDVGYGGTRGEGVALFFGAVVGVGGGGGQLMKSWRLEET